MSLEEYMKGQFPGLALQPPLFYNWGIGMRFELGTDVSYENKAEIRRYLADCHERAISLFRALHKPEDNLLVVMDALDCGQGISRGRGKFPAYADKGLLFGLKHHVFEDPEEDGCRIDRFILPCKTRELSYIRLLKAVCNYDLGVQPSLSRRVYFVNTSKNTIFHVYDDRGCDVLATEPAHLRDVYERYNGWILEYDRAETDSVFQE